MDKSEWQILNIRLVRLIDYYYYTFPPPPPALSSDFRLVLPLGYSFCLLRIVPSNPMHARNIPTV